jgi:GNAT superfamily N-acetyltransferase
MVVPANEASCRDLRLVFGRRDYSSRCLCRKFKLSGREWWETGGAHQDASTLAQRAAAMRTETHCGKPDAATTTGLVAYLADGEPVGWCNVEPRSHFHRLGQTPWKGRKEDKTDDSIWAITCFVTRVGFRRQGLTYPLARAAVDFARERGASALECYAMITAPDKEITWGELHVGPRGALEAAGMSEVARPSLRRVVMRIDF